MRQSHSVLTQFGGRIRALVPPQPANAGSREDELLPMERDVLTLTDKQPIKASDLDRVHEVRLARLLQFPHL